MGIKHVLVGVDLGHYHRLVLGCAGTPHGLKCVGDPAFSNQLYEPEAIAILEADCALVVVFVINVYACSIKKVVVWGVLCTRRSAVSSIDYSPVVDDLRQGLLIGDGADIKGKTQESIKQGNPCGGVLVSSPCNSCHGV